jgi:hypothetical protein
MTREYIETFDNGPGGWIAWGFEGAERVEIEDGVAISRGPWWVDYNHAPPGAGYLHLLFCLHTTVSYQTEPIKPISDENRFIAGGFPLDFTNAEITVRMRGDLDLHGSQVVLLAQADLPGRRVNQVLSAQPIHIGSQWSEQILHLVPDQKQWTQLGSRHDRSTLHAGNPNVVYGEGPINEVLKDLNVDIIFVLFPLDVAPAETLNGDPHLLRAGVDYPVDYSRLPEGVVELDEVRIKFAK